MEKAYETLCNMIEQREYKIHKQDDNKIVGINAQKEKIIIFLDPVGKFDISCAKKYIKLLDTYDINHCIIVYKDNITPVGKKVVNKSVNYKIELFHIKDLQYNITKHKWVPKHIKLSDKDGIEFKKKYGTKFPKIKETDPVSKFYNYKYGDVIKIIREGNYIIFRIVG